ncbi:predicted protein [Lichtheimia corymbifera JMRC:FSU:9682]|uniref:Uncharacterized protein n=1 Tax=Lichtheimia corymbifera JMRC:FSU:9682 TaxID=1263082 RepID=A0A068S7M2_9FUNG|nr:predicted protein [Lichtheimia corymbifera JMRC:FSU:9682]
MSFTPLSQVTCGDLHYSHIRWTADSHCIAAALLTSSNLFSIHTDSYGWDAVSAINYAAIQAATQNDQDTIDQQPDGMEAYQQQYWTCNGYGWKDAIKGPTASVTGDVISKDEGSYHWIQLRIDSMQYYHVYFLIPYIGRYSCTTL